LLLRISISAATMRAEPRVRKTNRRSNQAGETEQRRRGESPERMHAHEQSNAGSASVIAAATQL
jgi:hypothetical protein